MNKLFLRIVRMSVELSALIFVAATLKLSASENQPEIEFLGTATFPGDAIDKSGDEGVLENGEPRNRLGGFSALDFVGSGNRFAALCDRGPDDGAVGYWCRVQMLEINVPQQPQAVIESKLVQSIIFTDAEGRPFTGSSTGMKATQTVGHRFDPEGLRFAADKTMFVSDEYGPVLMQFSPEGREVRRFAMPSHLLIDSPHSEKKAENQANRSGRASNHGMEGLALSWDGQSLIGLMQGPLLQDGKRGSKGGVDGRNCRLISIDRQTATSKEFVYQLDDDDNGNSEIMAYGPDQFLVLERDGDGGLEAQYRRLIHIDLKGATDITGVASLPADELPATITPVRKTVFLDLLDRQWGLAGESMPAKIEGLTFGPVLQDGRQSLLIATDNDFEAANPSLIWVFAVSKDR